MPRETEVILGARILIVDDEEANLLVLKRTLQQAGYANLKCTTDPREVFRLYRLWEPQLIILDLLMPHLDGYQVATRLRSEVGEETYLPILVITADITQEAKRRALAVGTTDFLTKPFDSVEVVLRVGNLLQTRILHDTLQENLALRTRELKSLNTLFQRYLAEQSLDQSTLHKVIQEARKFADETDRLLKRSDELRNPLMH